jgi:hypothetical protein
MPNYQAGIQIHRASNFCSTNTKEKMFDGLALRSFQGIPENKLIAPDIDPRLLFIV